MLILISSNFNFISARNDYWNNQWFLLKILKLSPPPFITYMSINVIYNRMYVCRTRNMHISLYVFMIYNLHWRNMSLNFRLYQNKNKASIDRPHICSTYIPTYVHICHMVVTRSLRELTMQSYQTQTNLRKFYLFSIRCEWINKL